MDEQEGVTLGSEHLPDAIEDSTEPVATTEEPVLELENDDSEEVVVKDEGLVSETDKTTDNKYNHNEETESAADNDTGETTALAPEKIEPDDAEDTLEDSDVTNGLNVDNSDSSRSYINVKTDLIKSDDSEKCEENCQDSEMKENHADANTEDCQPSAERNEDAVENVSETVDTSVKTNDDEPTTMEVDQLNDSSDVKNDESRDKDNDPTFEDAPEHNANDTTSEDHREALDPFDELLKGGSSKPKSPTKEISTSTDDIHDDSHIDNDDSHMDNDDSHMDNHEDSRMDVDDHDASKDLSQEGTELAEEDEDEEVCLLPDTEREISEADKEKALAAKVDKVDPSSDKGETETSEDGETDKIHNAATNNVSDEPAVDEVPEKDKSLEEDDHEHEHEADNEPIILEEQPTSNTIQEIPSTENTCVQCSQDKSCKYRLMQEDVAKYLCSKDCLNSFQEANPDKYKLALMKMLIEEINAISKNCSQCNREELCQFIQKFENEDRYYCTNACVDSVVGDDKERYVIKRRKVTLEEITEKEANCDKCKETMKCRFEMKIKGEVKNICGDACIKKLTELQPKRFKVKRKKIVIVKAQMQPLLRLKVISNATDKYLDQGSKVIAKTSEQAAAARADRERSFLRKCHHCHASISGDEKNLSWETMDFCDDSCLGKYQNKIGSKCANCKNPVNTTSLGKYCVRFGYDIRQFCRSGCLEEFKKGLKICCYCQRDISGSYEGFLAPVGDKGQFKDFCSQACVAKFDQMSKNPVPPPVWAKCAVCSKEKPTTLEVAIDKDSSQRLCSEPCFAAFKFVNSVVPDQCRWCKKYFERKSKEAYTIYTDVATHCFCTKACMNVYISNSRHIVPCNWCKVKKYNFDMIRKTHSSGQAVMMCSLNCLTLYQVSVNAVSSRKIKCDQCKRTSQAQYHLTMSDATVRNFCTYQCVMSFQGQYAKPGQPGAGPDEPGAVPTGAPRRTYALHKNNVNATKPPIQQIQKRSSLPVISNVQSLASQPLEPSPHATRAKSKRLNHREISQEITKPQQKTYPKAIPKPPPKPVKEPPPPRPVTPPPPPPPPPPKIYNHVVVKTLPPVEVANKGTLTKPLMLTKGVSCRPHPCTKECQTDSSLERRILIPIPVPIYVPVPIAMYSMPFPVPVPIPIPIPTPVFIPTTRNSANGILKEIKKIHEKMPTDPFEAELLMMAEMVAGEKKKNESDSDTDEENADEGFSPDAMDGGNNFGEDMLQMALKMATEYEEPAVDLESAMTASTITPSSHPPMQVLDEAGNPMQGHHQHQMMLMEQQRAATAAAMRGPAGGTRKRGAAASAATRAPRPPYKRRRGEASAPTPPPPQPEPVREPAEKPDANMCLKYTFGVNAWKQWVMTKNAEIEKSSIRRKPFKSEILQLTADELNYSLCLFVKEVRKPNGSEYAPDTIYYLVLGIQQYLFENGRIDNIFTDPYYEKFTECLDEVARKFSVLYNDSQYIVTRVEEEHLWESKQLGAHSPHVLLSTLMFFNTKHFNLVTEEEHMQLSFSHIMKHWKRNPNQPGVAKLPGSRNVLLRFYPPQSALDANSRKKKVYEQQENEENPLRCPVKLYEFYLSKCPESVKTRNDVFYLMPERSCVPDSPVWYSTQPLAREALSKMLHRVKMVKEINIALLTS